MTFRIVDSIRDRFKPATGQRTDVNTALESVGRIASSIFPIDDVWDPFAESVRELIPFDRISVSYVDKGSGTFTESYASGLDVPGWARGDVSPLTGTVVGQAIGTDSGFLVGYESLEVLTACYPGLSPELDAGIRSVIAVPLIVSGQLVATFVLASVYPNTYSGRHLDLARRIGERLAAPVSNSRTYKTLRSETDDLAALAELGRIVGSSSETADVYEKLAEQVRLIVPFDQIAVALLDLEPRKCTNTWVGGKSVPGWEAGSTYEFDGAALRDTVEARSGIMVAADSPEELSSRFPQWPFIIQGGVRSIIVAPAVSNDEVVAALIVCSGSEKGYTEGDLELAKRIALLIGGPVASGVARDQVQSQLRLESDQSELSQEIGRAISAAPTTEEAYTVLAYQVRRLIPFDRIEIVTVDLEEATIRREHLSGLDVSDGAETGPEPVAGTTVQEAILTNAPLLLQGLSKEEAEFRFSSLTAQLEAGLQSFMTVPLISGGQAVGALSISSTGSEAYTERDLALAERVSFQIAGLIVGTHPKVTDEPEGEEPAVLAELGRIVTSSLDIGEVYESLAEKVRELIPFDRIVIWTVDLQRENLIASYVWGGDTSTLDQGTAFPLSSPAAQGVLEASSAVTVVEESVGAVAGRFPDLLQDTSAGRPAMLLMPLVSGDETVGMLSLRSVTAGAYAERDVAIGEWIAAQIAGAVANAQVYRETKQVERAVQDAVERLDLATGGSGDGLWDWKIGDEEVWWSPRLKELVGIHEEKERSGNRGWEARLHPEDRDRAITALDDHLEGRVPYDVRYRLQTGSGEYRCFNDRGQAIWDESGTAVRMSGSLRDVTEAKSASPGSLDLSRPLETSEVFKRTLIEGRNATQDSDGGVLVTRLAPAARHMARVISDLQTFSRVMDSEVRREPVALDAIARSVARKIRKSHARRNVKLSIARGMAVEGDESLLRVMMENLLDNAWKFTGKHERATIEFGSTTYDGKQAYYVRDDSAGFDMAEVDRLFGLFQRLHPANEFEGNRRRPGDGAPHSPPPRRRRMGRRPGRRRSHVLLHPLGRLYGPREAP